MRLPDVRHRVFPNHDRIGVCSRRSHQCVLLVKAHEGHLLVVAWEGCLLHLLRLGFIRQNQELKLEEESFHHSHRWQCLHRVHMHPLISMNRR